MIKIKLIDYGFFAVVNNALECILIAKEKKEKICFEWISTYYGKKNTDCWSYYFDSYKIPKNQNVFNKTIFSGTYIYNYGLDKKKICPDGPKYKFNGGKKILLNPKISSLDKIFIKKKFKFSKKIKKKIEKITNIPKIGLHLRGIGKLDGGVDLFQLKLFFNFKSLYNFYLEIIKKINEPFFLATDSGKLHMRVVKIFGKKVISNKVARSKFGETHLSFKRHNNYKIGEEVILDVISLSFCKKIIASPGNIRNFLKIFTNNKIIDIEKYIKFEFKKKYNFFLKIFYSLVYSFMEKIRLFNLKKITFF